MKIQKRAYMYITIVVIILAFSTLIALNQQTKAAGALEITTTAIDAGQINQLYFYKMTTNGTVTSGDDGADSWRFVSPNDTEMLTIYGLDIGNQTGYIAGTPAKKALNLPVKIGCSVDSNGTFYYDEKTYFLTIAGILRFDSGPKNPGDTTVVKGQANVPVMQLRLTVIGEDIEITSLKFYGLGTGSDTNDIKEVNLYLDQDDNGVVSGGEVPITVAKTFSTAEGFLNSSVTFSGNPLIRIDSNVAGGIRNFLVTYTFWNHVESNRTFRLAFEKPTDITYKTVTTSKTYTGSLGGGSPYTSNNMMAVQWYPNYADYPPYKGGVVTVQGETPSVPTLFMGNAGMATDSVYVRAGSETKSVSFWCWADTSHTIRIDKIIFLDSGTGDAASHLSSVKLFNDIDKNGVISAADPLIVTGTITGDQITFDNINRTITTPTGQFTDAGALYFLVVYKFKTDVPILTPPLTFQGYIPSASYVTAKEVAFGTSAEVKPDTPSIFGNVLAVNQPVDTSTSGGTTSGPYPTRAVWFDVDTNSLVSRGDTILVSFDTNLNSASATADKFLLPVLGDNFGAGATFGAASTSNGMKITLGTDPVLRIKDTYAAGTHTFGSASGLNIKDTTATLIVSIYGLTAGPAVNTLDIESGVVSYALPDTSASSSSSSDTSSSSSSASSKGDKACIISRTLPESRLFTLFRALREFMLESKFGRMLVEAYYSI